MATSKSKSPETVSATSKVDLVAALGALIPVGGSKVLEVGDTVAIIFHLRPEGVRKSIESKGVTHDITEFAQTAQFRGVQRVVDGEQLSIGAPKSGVLNINMSVYNGNNKS